MDALFSEHRFDQLLVLIVVPALYSIQIIGPLVGGLSDLPDLYGIHDTLERAVEISVAQLAQDLLGAEEPFVGRADLALQRAGSHVLGQEITEMPVELVPGRHQGPFPGNRRSVVLRVPAQGNNAN